MEFCPKCGCVLVEKTKVFGCPRCGYTTKEKVVIEASEKLKIKGDIVMITNNDDDVFPIITAKCPKCSNKEAYFWTSQTRAGDEAETRFFRCTKCKHTWREYK